MHVDLLKAEPIQMSQVHAIDLPARLEQTEQVFTKTGLTKYLMSMISKRTIFLYVVWMYGQSYIMLGISQKSFSEILVHHHDHYLFNDML